MVIMRRIIIMADEVKYGDSGYRCPECNTYYNIAGEGTAEETALAFVKQFSTHRNCTLEDIAEIIEH